MRHWTQEERIKQSQLINQWKPWKRAKYRKKNGWSEERRIRHRELIKRWRPWERSTGPKTVEGKVIVSRNALKHGGRCAEVRRVQRILLDYRKKLSKVRESKL